MEVASSNQLSLLREEETSEIKFPANLKQADVIVVQEVELHNEICQL